MIIFHEGMPRSGKSHGALADHIIPALKKSRKVYCRIDGLDHEKIAEVVGIDADDCRRLLIELTEEDVQNIHKLDIDNDSLIVIDEAQNYWPQQRLPLSPEMTKFISEHGHHGWDILLMGQLLKDVHRTWQGRTNRKIQFVKKDVFGKPNEYKWVMYNGVPDSRGNVKFIEIQKGDGSYQEKYFGCYKSHSDGTENKDTYTDDRVVIWNHPMFKKWLPIFGVVAFCAIGFIIYLFNGGLAGEASATESNPQKQTGPKPISTTQTITTSGPDEPPKTVVLQTVNAPATPAPAPAPTPSKPKDDFDIPDLITQLSAEHKIRLAAVIRTTAKVRVVVEWRDSSHRIIHTLDNRDLETLGWHILTSSDDRIVILTRPGAQKQIVTAWPIQEPIATPTTGQHDQIRRQSRDFIRMPDQGA